MKVETADHIVEDHSKPTRTITVTVNQHTVTFNDHKAIGLEIKQTAIAQGVQIQLDFVLFEVKGGGNLKQVNDNETVTLHPNQEFRAVTPDDKS